MPETNSEQNELKNGIDNGLRYSGEVGRYALFEVYDEFEQMLGRVYVDNNLMQGKRLVFRVINIIPIFKSPQNLESIENIISN